jgi:hypothetical protein
MADSTPPQDPFEVFRRLWGPLGLPVPGMAVPTLDPKEVDKRLAELRSVASWLQVNLNMVNLAIQGLEMQRAALLAMGAGAEPGTPAGASAAVNLPWPWAMMQQAMGGPPPAGGAAAPDAAPEEPKEPKKPKQ